MNMLVNELYDRGLCVCLVPINSGAADRIIPKCDVFEIRREWEGGAWNTFLAWVRFVKLVWNWGPTDLVLNCDVTEFFGATSPIHVRNLIVVEHANPAWSTRQAFGRIIRRILALRSAKWVAVSSHLTIWPSKGKPDAVLQNSVEFPANPKVIYQNDSKCKIERLVFVGRLAEQQKRPSWVLEIAHSLDYPVLFVGEGSMRKELMQNSEENGSKSEFSGFVTDPWSLILKGDLLLFPSAWEGDGLVVLEAMVQDIPFLLTDIPDFRRFNLPEENYCSSIENFKTRIREYSPSLELLRIPNEVRSPILDARNNKVIGDSWEKYFLEN
jgi:glycosyltransferase involved in cell wall biosynthesis